MFQPAASTSSSPPLVAEMCQVTGCSQQIAGELLQRAGQDLAVAVDRFYSQLEGVVGRDNKARIVDDLNFDHIFHVDPSTSGVRKKEADHPDVINISSDSDASLPEVEEDKNNNLMEQQMVSMFPMIPGHLIREKLLKTDRSQEAVARLTETFLGHQGSFDDVIIDDENEDDWVTKKLNEMKALFPIRCPDWLEKVLQEIAASAGEDDERERLFNVKVEEIFSLPVAEQAKLPTLLDWKAKKQLQEELELWTNQITVRVMLDLYKDPISAFYESKRPQTLLYKEHSLAGLRKEFRRQSAVSIARVFSGQGDRFAPSRRELLFMGYNTRKNRRPDKEIKSPAEPCLAFLKERKFCELEGEIKEEMERMRMLREKNMLMARTSGLVEECVVCLSENLPCEMVPCQAGHRFCFSCVEMTALQVLGSGKGRVGCLSLCDKEVEGNMLKKVLKQNVFSKLMVNRQSEELSAAGLENLVSCPFCPYQTIMDNLQDKVIRCLNPECGRDSCRKCKMANHVPLTCEEVITRSRRRLEEELTMSWVRECSKCKINFERISGCNMMTCPRCGQVTCYICRQAVTPGGVGYEQHARCGDTMGNRSNEQRHQEELAQAEKRLKTDLDLFKQGPSK